MPAKKAPVSTPLHLLQQLSHSLVTHLHKACEEAQRDAEMLLAKLEKQRGKTQEKIIKARARLDEAGNAGKSKAQAKARSRLAELDDMLAVLQARQGETLSYLTELKRDAEQCMKLAQGVSQVEQAAAQALSSRGRTASPKTRRGNKAPSKPAGSAPVPSMDSNATGGDGPSAPAGQAGERAKTVATNSPSRRKPAAGKAATGQRAKASSSVASTAAESTSGNGSASPAVKKPASKRPAARKPAPARRKPAIQSAGAS